MVMKECREGQNPELNNPCDRKFRERGVVEGIFCIRNASGNYLGTSGSMEAGGVALESDDLGSNHWCVLENV